MSSTLFTISDIVKASQIDRGEAELIVAEVLGKSKEFVVAHPEYRITENGKGEMENMIKRRKEGEPMAYIFGTKEFFGREFFVTPDTLIPRPETEILVEEVLRHLASALGSGTTPVPDPFPERGQVHRNVPDPNTENPSASKTRHLPFAGEEKYIIDIGTGSGCVITSIVSQLRNFQFPTRSCVATSLLYAISNFQCFGIDISEQALRVAKKNAKKFGEDKDITFLQSNLLDFFLSPVSPLPLVACHLSLVANLPYVPTPYLKQEKTQLTEGIFFEPLGALDGGEDGFDLYRKLLRQIQTLKEKNPSTSIDCFFEIGSDQKDIAETAISRLFPETRIFFTNDLSGQVRVVQFHL